MTPGAPEIGTRWDASGRVVQAGQEMIPALGVAENLAIGQVRVGELHAGSAGDLDQPEFDGGGPRR